MATTVKRRNKPGLNTRTVREKVRQFVGLDAEAKVLEKRRKELRDDLVAVIEEYGYEDPNEGHSYFDLGDETVEGVTRIKRERRVSRSLDREKAMALITERGLESEVIQWQPVIDEDALYEQVYHGKIKPEEIDDLVVEKISYAFKPVR